MIALQMSRKHIFYCVHLLLTKVDILVGKLQKVFQKPKCWVDLETDVPNYLKKI